MHRLRLFALSCSLLVTAVAGAAEDPVVAIVNGEQVRRSELAAVHQALPEQYRQMPIETLYDPLLSRVIDNRLLAKEAEKAKLDNEPDVKAALAQARRDVLREQMLQNAVEQGSTPDRLQHAYNAMKQQPGFAGEEVRAHHILVKTEQEAKDVIAALANGESFEKLAKERSIDPSAKSNGGDLGYFRREMMVGPFAEAAFSIPAGTVSKEPIETQFGWHVIKVDDKRTAVPSFEEKEDQVREQVAREIITALLQKVRDGAEVQRFNLDGSPKAN